MNNQNQESEIKAFLEAVNYLFHSNDKDLKQKANKFLVEFESKSDSWDIAYQVLLKDNLPEEVYYNALNILKNKIKFDFGNYSENPEYIEKLLSFFLNNINRFKKMKHYILINYCDCIGKAFLFTGYKFNSLLKNFTFALSGQNSDIESLISLLLIFNFICETKFDKRIVIDEKSREIFSDNIKSITGDVFQYIIFMIKKLPTIEDNNLKNFISKQILETINNYLYINLAEDVILKFNEEYLPIINFIFQIDEENLEKHNECICSLLYLPLQKEKMQNLAKIIFSKIFQFKDIFYKSIESLDDEQSSFYIDIFTLMVEQNMDEILKENRLDFFQIIVDLLKKCPEKKIYTIVDFFKNFNDYLYRENYSIDDIMKNFKNLFMQLISNFMLLTKFDDEIFTKLNQTLTKKLHDNEDYNRTLDFRSAAKEFLNDFVMNYGISIVFSDILFPEFKNIVMKIRENPKDMNNFCKLENILFIFSCICKYTNSEDPSYKNVITLFYTIFDIPKEYTQIIRTVTDIMDNSAGILSDSKELLEKGFQYLIRGLDNDLTVKYCSVSAKYLLSKNKEIMSDSRKILINLYDSKIKNKVFTNEKYLFILEGVTIAITYSENKNDKYNEIKQSLIHIMNDWVYALQQAKNILEKNNIFSPEENSNVNKILVILKSISSSAFEGLPISYNKIMSEILSELYPTLIYIFKTLSTDSVLVEKIIQLLKIYMRGLVDNFINFIPEYVNCIINGYKLSPISSYLYGFEILITAYPNRREEELVKILNSTFEELCKITLNNYIKNIFDLNIHVQIGDDFYGMLYRIMKDSPLIILESNFLENLIKISLDYISTPQIHIAKNIMRFFNNFIKFQKSKYFQELSNTDKNLAEKFQKIIENILDKFGSLLCQKILEIYINNSVEQIIESVSELFNQFIYCNKTLVVKGMSIHLKNCPNDILTNKEKAEFINLIEEYSVKEKEFNKFLDNFINRCINKQIRARGQN